MSSSVHFIEIPTGPRIEDAAAFFPYCYYRILIHYEPGETVLIHANPLFARFVHSENRSIPVIETALQEECQAVLDTFDRLRQLRIPGFNGTMVLPGAEPYF
jgi:hypothetical protein